MSWLLRGSLPVVSRLRLTIKRLAATRCCNVLHLSSTLADGVLYLTTLVKYCNVEGRRTTLVRWSYALCDDVRMGTTACRAALPTCRARERPLVSCGSAHEGRHRVGDGSECCRPPGCREPSAHYQSRAREGHARAGHRFPARSPRSAPARADLLRRLSERTSDLPVAYRRFKR